MTMLDIRRYRPFPIQDRSYQVASIRKIRQNHLDKIDPATGLIKSEWMESCCCAFCSETRSTEHAVRWGVRFVRCAHCGLIYQNPRPRPGVVLIEGGTLTVDGLYKEETREKRASGFMVDRWKWVRETVNKPKARLLDVGCHYGTFSRQAIDAGWEVVGLEPEPQSAEIARKAGLTVMEAMLEEADLPEQSFDAACVWDVYWAPTDLKLFQARLHRALKPGSSVFLSDPNQESFESRYLGGLSGFPAHSTCIHNNGASVLRRVFEETGFEVIEHWTAGNDLIHLREWIEAFGEETLAGHEDPAVMAGLRHAIANMDMVQPIIDAAGLGAYQKMLAKRI